MLGLGDLRQTRVYQEALEEGKLEGRLEGKHEGRLEGKLEGRLEGKLESVPRLLALGLSLEQIAEALGLDVATVRQAAQQSSN